METGLVEVDVALDAAEDLRRSLSLRPQLREGGALGRDHLTVKPADRRGVALVLPVAVHLARLEAGQPQLKDSPEALDRRVRRAVLGSQLL